jgi:hypothetical protein
MKICIERYQQFMLAREPSIKIKPIGMSVMAEKKNMQKAQN